MKRIIAIFGYPIDNSVRAKVYEDMPSVYEDYLKYKDICYLVVAFEATGEILLFEDVLAQTPTKDLGDTDD